MSRGARGGGRGGRGGGRGGRPNVPWDTGDEPDARPSELFPPYAVPSPRLLTTPEKSSVQHFLLLRHQMHASPIYTSKRSVLRDPTAPRKTYGQEQANAQFGTKNRASIDPFTAVDMYSHRFVREERALPDWTGRPVCKELFPDELADTVDPVVGDGRRKRRRLELSKVSALPNAEAAFGMVTGEEGEEMDESRRRNLLDRLAAIGGEEEEGAELEEEEGLEEEGEDDEIYDDSDAGDYDAENYFDNGDEMGEDYGDGGDEGGATFE